MSKTLDFPVKSSLNQLTELMQTDYLSRSMALLDDAIRDKKFDSRLAELNVSRKVTSKKELEDHIKGLSDDESIGDWVNTDELTAQDFADERPREPVQAPQSQAGDSFRENEGSYSSNPTGTDSDPSGSDGSGGFNNPFGSSTF